MRKAVSKLHWQGRGVVVALALVVGILGLFLLYSTVRAVPPPFPAYATTDVVDTEVKVNSDIHSTFGVPDDDWPAAMYDSQVSFTPGEWGVAAGEDIPIGAIVGKLIAEATLGWFNSPCSAAYGGALHIGFDPLLNCSKDTSDAVAFADGFTIEANGLPAGCNKYPAFLNTMFPGMTPIARYGAFENIGINVSLNFVVFEPGTSLPLPGLPAFAPAKGYVAMSVLNDPTGPLVPNQITDRCPPLGTTTTYYGLTKDNPATTSVDEKDYKWRTNPQCPGTYTFNGYAGSMRDADSDGYDNGIDSCPHIANEGDPRVQYSGDTDNDGLDNACDPTPGAADADPDTDGFPNRQDNCPLVANAGQEDGDYDGIGNACDQADWNNDGDTTDPGEPTGFSPTTPNGDKTEVWFETPIEITGEECAAADATPTPTATATATATATETVVAGVETTLAEDAAAGDTEIVVADATGFAVGDAIKIGSGDTEETNTIAAIDGETITLATALEFDHLADEPVVKVQAIVATPSPTIEGDICSPVFPGTYNGRVLINGTPAASGYQLTASIGDAQWGSAIIAGGRYAMDIPDHMPTVKPCFEGGTITFALNGMTCTPVEEGADEWGSGIRNVDLDCAPVAPPVTPTVAPPTPTTKPPATPSPAPTKMPPTGAGGLSGASSGLPLWATALASWVGLMTVAGLGTLVAAKRR
jgi:hypothetical protein